MRLAINGFGRIGRQCLRIILKSHPDIDVVLINDLTDPKTLAHLFEFDSTYGHFDCGGDACSKAGALTINGKAIRTTATREPENLPHEELGVDVVLECTGFFLTREKAELHRKAGAKKVILSAPAKDEIDGTFCIGVNEDRYDPKTMHIVSNASCTTNCLAPMAKVLHEHCGIVQGFMTTVHSYTNDQNLLDLPHKDLRRARAAAVNMVPTSTGAAKAVGLVLPELKGKLNGIAIRVPTPTGSITDLTAVVAKKTNVEAVNAAFRKASESKRLNGILGYEERPLVQSDFVGDPRSCIFDAPLTQVNSAEGFTLVKIFGWYDNEWGYSSRLVELAQLIGSTL